MSAPLNATPTRVEFDALVAQLAEVEAITSDQSTDEHFDLAGELIGKIMHMPAPDAEALRWKLDWIMAPSHGGGSQAYTEEYVAQTVADYRRMLTPDRVDAPIQILADAAGDFETLRHDMADIVSLAGLLSTSEILDRDGRQAFRTIETLVEVASKKAESFENASRAHGRQLRGEQP